MKFLALSPIGVVFLIATCQAASWTTSPWGPDDQLGAANYLNSQLVRQTSSLIKTGKTYHLGMIIDSKTPSFPPRTFSLSVIQPNQFGEASVRGNGPIHVTYHDEIIMGWVATGTQIDGLGHVGIRTRYYNGFNRSEFARTDGLLKFGVEGIPPIVTRGVLLNMAQVFGKDMLTEGTAYTREDIKKAEKMQNVNIRRGDVVIFHSGWLNLAEGSDADRLRFIQGEPGLGLSGARYLVEKGVVAVGADTAAVEVIPPEVPGEDARVHLFLIPKNGVYILEYTDTRKLAEDGVSEFVFVLGVPRIRGAGQMMINPIAIT